MVDNKKLKMPSHLALDSVSPATRLLEKRRLMYEVQKAFEDQKKDFKKEEERCRVREKELREKDILIQDNLIRFSTFLQQQEMRKKKDLDAALLEEAKILEKEAEIEQQELQKKMLYQTSNRIKKKLEKLSVFAKFLEKVREENQDEFNELSAIVSRFDTLNTENQRLDKVRQKADSELNELVKQIEFKRKEQEDNNLTTNNNITQRQKDFEKEEQEKQEILKNQEEKTEGILSETREHGSIIMTIKNLHDKILGDPAKELLPMGKEEQKEKDKMDIEQKANMAKDQLKDIYSFVDVFEQLRKKLEQPPSDDKNSISSIDFTIQQLRERGEEDQALEVEEFKSQK